MSKELPAPVALVHVDRGSSPRRRLRRPHLVRTPGFTLVAVLTLAVGISAVTVIYSVLRNVALDPFPYSRSDRLVNVVFATGPAASFADRISAPRNFSTIRSRPQRSRTSSARASSARTGWGSGCRAARAELDDAERLRFLGVPPLFGRVFDYRDVAPGAPPVAVMGHRAWVRRFGADPGVIGRTLVLDGGLDRHRGDAAALRVEHRRSVAAGGDAAQRRSADAARARAFRPTCGPASPRTRPRRS